MEVLTAIFFILLQVAVAMAIMMLGIKAGRKLEKELAIEAFEETMNSLEEAQKEAGVTPQQFKKINKSLVNIIRENIKSMNK